MQHRENNSRGLLWIGGLSLAFGALVVAGYSAFLFTRELFTDPDVPLGFQIAVPAIFLGLLVLIVAVVRDRMKHRKDEGLEEVKW